MRLLTIGDTTVNLDQAIEIEDHGDRIEVYYVVVNNEGQPLLTTFEGDEAEALRRWIARNAENASQFEDGSTGEALNEPQPYTSPR